MQLQLVLKKYIHERFLSDADAVKALSEFFKNIPGRVLQVDIDPNARQKTGFTKQDSIYKFDINPSQKLAALEFYAHRSQGAPTMALYLDAEIPKLSIVGNKVDKRFMMVFVLKDDAVTHTVQYDD